MSEEDDNNWLWLVISAVVIIGVVLVLYLLRKFAQGKQFNSDAKLTGKVVIITGANTGIGKETAIDLASRGAKIYLACRDTFRCEEARKDIIERTGTDDLYNRILDLSSLSSVRNFVKEFLEEETKLDILICNAGIMNVPKSLTTDGFELQFGVNHLGHFLLTNLLLDSLKKATPSRIVVVSSHAYLRGNIKKEDLNSEVSYGGLSAYCQSKLANILFTRHLSKKLEGTGVTVNALHPGVVKTELGRHIPFVLRMIIKPFTFFFKTPKSGAQTSIKLAVDPYLEDVSGKYFKDCTEVDVKREGLNDELGEWLWNKSEELVGLSGVSGEK